MATLVLIKKRRECERRRELFEKKKEHKRFVKDVLESWDKGKTGTLTWDELRQWLTSIAQGEPATDDEVKWVMTMATQERSPDYEKVHIQPDNFSAAAEAWLSYRESKSEIDAIFNKYDTDSSGCLDKAQLKNLLTELNAGDEPLPEELDWVLQNADVIGDGVINKPELAKAISVWYVHVQMEEERQQAMQKEAVKANGICGPGGCSIQ
eukprot:CAMPEP_0184304128 /NCGR_PEP_ID=MMETSP1049-20130417/13731_1 /TAXON_ID=77928 /ORGANISM="Proteomonas sulcata, Strain CCMP704" /LENGTH=208 /DNA_ID=CAMNT_0026615871 /DNA_START=59 /DNA_END=685 /DNA_ORIENTATION=+